MEQSKFINLLIEAFNKYQGKIAIVDKEGSRKTSYDEIFLLAKKTAAYLKDKNIKRHSCITIELEENMEYMAVEIGIWFSGCTIVPLGHDYPLKRKTAISKECKASLSIDDNAFEEILLIDPIDNPIIPDEEDTALILFTSGSTGVPKGVVHSFASMWNATSAYKAYGFNEDGRFAAGIHMTFMGMNLLYAFAYGMEVHLIMEVMTEENAKLVEYFKEHHITAAFCGPAKLSTLELDTPYFKTMVVAGDRMRNIPPHKYEIINAYGQTETAGLVMYTKQIVEGKPTTFDCVADGCEVTVMDENGHEVPYDSEGEICVRGKHCDGYLHDEERTKKLYADGWLHTGDNGILRDKNKITFVSRRDWMVKVNGQRVELGEVEYAMKGVPGIKDAIAIAYENDNGSKFIAGYYIPENGTDIEETFIREEMSQAVTFFMIPRVLIPMKAFPLNRNGKIDRMAFELPEELKRNTAYVAPENEIEQKICDAFKKVLNVKQVGAEDDFFSLGGDSILIMELLQELSNQTILPARLSSKDVFAGKTPRGIAAIWQKKQGDNDKINPAINKMPLTKTQQAIYFETKMREGEAAYNTPSLLRFSKKLDATLLMHAIQKVVSAHCGFGVSIRPNDDGIPYMEFNSTYLSEPVVTYHRLTKEQFEKKKAALIYPFALDYDRLFRMEIIETKEDMYLFMDVHHVIFDGTSMRIFLTDLQKAYLGEKILKETFTCFDASLLEQTECTAEAMNEAKIKLQKLFENIEGVTRPEGDLHLDNKSFATEKYCLEDTFSDICAFAQKNDITPNVFFTAAFGITLAKYTNSDTGVFASIYNGRTDARMIRTVSMFVKTIPVLCRISSKTQVIDYLKSVKENVLYVMGCEAVSFAEQAEITGVNSDVLFAYQDDMYTFPNIGDALLRSEELTYNSTGEIFAAEVKVEKDTARFEVEYRSDLYSSMYIKAFMKAYAQVVKSLLTVTWLDDISLVPKEDMENILLISTGDKKPFDEQKTYLEAFNENVIKRPDNIVVRSSLGAYSYKELDDRSNKIAHKLLNAGIKEKDFVAIKLKRCIDYFAAVLGINKVGAAYVPIDISYPVERIDYMLSDCGATVVITEEYLRTLPDDNSAVMEAKGDNPAYMIYTSGSTGKPKGVVILHKSISALAAWSIDEFGLDETKVNLHQASFSFDASTLDLFYPLMAGGQVLLLTDDERTDILKIKELMKLYHVTGMTISTAMGMMLINDGDIHLDYMMMGGEKLMPMQKTDTRIYNGYGPTEFTVCSSFHVVDQDKDIDIPIGKAVPNSVSLICDREGNLLPLGMVGELCLVGAQISPGYMNREDITRKVFTDCKVIPGAKMYRTGDLACYNADGELEFKGRIDSQVKLRGFRIELGEVENRIASYEGINQVCAKVIKNATAEYLCVFFTAQNTIDIEKLKAHASIMLTEYMLPSYYVQLDEMPLTPNGKIDIKALPSTEINNSDEKTISPKTKMEKVIYKEVSTLLETEDFGVNTNLFSIGLTSLMAMRLSSALYHNHQIELSTKDIMTNPVIISLASQAKESNGGYEKKYVPHPYREFYPITENQKGVYFDCVANRNTVQYNVPQVYHIDDHSKEEIVKAVQTVFDKHPILKANLVIKGSTMMLKRNDDIKAQITCINEILTQERLMDRIRPFDLLNDNLYRAELYTAPQGYYLFIDIHHIIFDGSSGVLFAKELTDALQGKDIEKETCTFFDFALDENITVTSEKYEKAHLYFKELLSCNEDTYYPLSKIPDEDNKRLRKVSMRMNGAKISKFSKRENVTLSSFYMTAFLQTLHRILRQEKITIASVTSGRDNVNIQDTIGMFVKTLPVVSSIEKDSVSAAIKKIQEQYVLSQEHSIFPYTQMAQEFGVKNSIMFVYQGGLIEENPLAAKELTALLSTPKSPMVVIAQEERDDVVFEIEYDASYYRVTDMERLLKAFCNVAEGMCVDNRLFSDVSLSSDTEIKEMLKLCKVENVCVQLKITYVDAFIAQVKKQPKHPAVLFGDSSYTYEELDTISNRVAHQLLAMNVSQGGFVAIMLHRSKEFFAAVIGVSKAGAGYVPIDPTYPRERINYIISDCGAKVVITEEFFDNLSSDDSAVNNAMAQLPAYMIYTSGSTGNPKGVVILHKSIMACAAWLIPEFELNENKVNLHHPSFSFDASTHDLFYPMIAGASVYVLSEEERKDVFKIQEIIQKRGITGMTISTAMGMMLINETDVQLEYMMLGGEKFIPVKKTSTRLYNGYGPTEFTVCSSYHIVDGDKDTDIPIGKAVPNSYSFICDMFGNLLPMGFSGELNLVGEQMAHEYWNRDDLTRERFVECKFMPGKRMYRTGDLVRYNSNGELEFEGRIDNQIKLHGYRVELGEIENRISSFPGIKQVCVLVRKLLGNDRLCVYYSAEEKIESKALKQYCAETLTEYMVPSIFVQLDTLPLTVNGKIDMKALPEPKPDRDNAKKRLPKISMQEQVCKAYCEVLGMKEIYLDDDFFELGGTSLTAMKVVMLLKSSGVDATYEDIFDHSVAEDLSSVLQSRNSKKVKISESNNEADAKSGIKQVIQMPDDIKEALKYNTIEHTNMLSTHELGDVLLTGATGYLGIHILKELIDQGSNKIYCVLRKGSIKCESRLKIWLEYYFDNPYEELIGNRIRIIEADITDMGIKDILLGVNFDTVINCAACVKHFTSGDILERTNVKAVENLIDVCLNKDVRFVQISTTSVPGVHTSETYEQHIKMHENELFVVNSMDNKYTMSKYHAEYKVLEGINKGLKGKIMRVGNLMGRYSDGEFQANYNTNLFLAGIKGFVSLGLFPIGHSTDQISLSPIDSTAQAVLKLAGTNDEFTAFNVNSRYTTDEMRLINSLIQNDILIKWIEDDKYYEIFNRKMGDNADNDNLKSLAVYDRPDMHALEVDNQFTVNILYRLGFSWPIPTDEYLYKIVNKLKTLGYFDL